VGIDEGLRETGKWYREHGYIPSGLVGA
jgi:hypothetical protein